MEGFKKIAKMQCFKEGGSVQRQIANYEKRERKTEEKADEAQDKKIVKKAIGMHDSQEHEGEHTDLSKLKKGGRAKKAQGTVKKYKTGGTVANVYEAKKSAGDLDAIEEVKSIKPAKAAAPSKASVVSKSTPAKFCAGKSVKKMADGGMSGRMSELDKKRALEKMARAKKYLGPAQQSELINQSPAAAGLSAPAAAGVQPPATMPAVDQMGAPTGPAMKKGGKARK